MTVMDGLNFGIGFILAIVTSATMITLFVGMILFMGQRD